MGKALADAFPICRDTFAEADRALGEPPAILAVSTAACRLLEIVGRRGCYMQEAVPVGEGAMAAILGLDAGAVAQACAESAEDEIVSPANLNGAGQVVIAGAREAVRRAGERAKALGARRVVPLAVSAPFHCALMKPAEDRLAPDLRALSIQNPRVPVVANLDAEPKHRRECRD
jgi:[acyl-carrier-protein] S-malonyltransferase